MKGEEQRRDRVGKERSDRVGPAASYPLQEQLAELKSRLARGEKVQIGLAGALLILLAFAAWAIFFRPGAPHKSAVSRLTLKPVPAMPAPMGL